LGEILIDSGVLSENDLLSLFSEELGVPYMPNLSRRTMETSGIKITRETYETLYSNLCPLNVLESEEYLPYRSEITKGENGRTKWDVFCFICNPWHYIRVIEHFQRILVQHGAINEIELPSDSNESPADSEKPSLSLADVSHLNVYMTLARRGDILRTIEELKEFNYMRVTNAEVENVYSNVRMFWEIVNTAIQTRCSDIHIAPNNANGGLNVRFRRDGDLAAEDRFSYGSEKFPIAHYDEFANIIFNEAKMQSQEKNVTAMDGSLQYSLNGTSYDMRIASVPVLVGQRVTCPKITIRILYKSNSKEISDIGIRTVEFNDHGIFPCY
jgi:type II secretory ATPase GspE/PulE/Tfp pilus assembly ATPase PilB-like protein